MTRKLIASFVAAFALVLGLAGCSDPKAEASKNFVGTWELESMSQDGAEYSEEELAMLKQFGLSVYLDVTEDGAASLEMFGTEIPATWTAKDATTITITIDEDATQDAENSGLSGEQEATFADDKVSMTSGDTSMSFKKIDPSEKVQFDSSNAVSVEGTEEVEDDAEETKADEKADDKADDKANEKADEKAEDDAKADDKAAEGDEAASEE